MDKLEKNIDMLLYRNFYNSWLENEDLDNLIGLFNLDWEFLWNNARILNSPFLESKEIVFNRIKEIEKEIERREGGK